MTTPNTQGASWEDFEESVRMLAFAETAYEKQEAAAAIRNRARTLLSKERAEGERWKTAHANFVADVMDGMRTDEAYRLLTDALDGTLPADSTEDTTNLTT